MKILAFTDVHANETVLEVLKERAQDADLIICAGDVAMFGSGLEESFAEMNSWNKPILLIHGNEPHESQDQFEELLAQFENLEFIHGKEHTVGTVSVLGWGGGGFAKSDEELAQFAKTLEPKAGRIFVVHGPPYNTTADRLEGYGPTGCKTRRQVIEALQPFLVLCGHIHENFGKSDKIGKSLILNPGPIGKYIEVNAKKPAEQLSETRNQAPRKNTIKKKANPAARKKK